MLLFWCFFLNILISIYFQDSASSSSSYTSQTSRHIVMSISLIGIFFFVVEMVCYSIFFASLTNYNNTVASALVNPSVIKFRNKTNAISVFGLFASWVLQISDLLIYGVFATQFKMEWLREVTAVFKGFDFLWIPIIQILTTPPMRKMVFSKLKEN